VNRILSRVTPRTVFVGGGGLSQPVLLSLIQQVSNDLLGGGGAGAELKLSWLESATMALDLVQDAVAAAHGPKVLRMLSKSLEDFLAEANAPDSEVEQGLVSKARLLLFAVHAMVKS
jgi:hypothetical protein